MKHLVGGEYIAMGIPGETVDSDTRRLIQRLQPGGFILFARNIKHAEQVRALTDELRNLVRRRPLITLDEEGGRVSRLKPLLKHQPPSIAGLSLANDPRLIQRHGELTGRMLRLLGFNLNLAPVLDIDVPGVTTDSLHMRTFGQSPEDVVRGARAYVCGLRKHGILNCGKHFPGYAHAAVDPHKDLPVVAREANQLAAFEWQPFKELLPVLDSIMTAHVRFPSVDGGEHPASLSPHLVQYILRDRLNYDRCVITDDLDMGAVTSAYDAVRSAKLALKAGNDLLLVCHNFDALEDIARGLGRLSPGLRSAASRRIANLRRRALLPRTFTQAAFARVDADFGRLNEKLT